MVAIRTPYGSVSKRPRSPNLRRFVLVEPFDINPPAHHPAELSHNDTKWDALGEEQGEAVARLDNPIKARGDQGAIDARAVASCGVMDPVVVCAPVGYLVQASQVLCL